MMFTLLVTVFSLSGFAQKATNSAESVVKFKELKHNFGKIKQGVPVTHDFEFTNVSSGAVIVETATASCGMKSKTDKIKAGFNAAAPGPFEKTVYVKLKGVDAPMELKIAGEVLSAAEYDKLNKK